MCVHHLYFSSDDYKEKGNRIKCNPAIKAPENRDALLPALLDDRLDIIATDHAPHTIEEKNRSYINAPSGLPLVQHAINIMMEMVWQGKLSMTKVVEKMCHAPADCFRLRDRGFLEEGMYADIALINPNMEWEVAKENILYKCGWSPLDGKKFKGRVVMTMVNGHKVFDLNHGYDMIQGKGMRAMFH